MKYKPIIGHEIILLISCVGFGVLLLPAVIFLLILAPAGVLSQAESFGDCYAVLFKTLGGYDWLPLLFLLGPYIIVQIWRFYKGKLGRDYVEDSDEDDHLFSSFSKKVGSGSINEYSGMSWRQFSIKDKDVDNDNTTKQ